jgi:hypothetical protein
VLETAPKLSQDSAYLRVQRPDNLLRWDLTVKPGQTGEKAAALAYQFKLEYASKRSSEWLIRKRRHHPHRRWLSALPY